MLGGLSALQGPLIVFCLVVAPLWIIFHYRHKNQVSAESSEQDREKIEALLNRATKMEDRVAVLEDILDKNHPQWRHET